MELRYKQEKIAELEERLWHYMTLEAEIAVKETKKEIERLKKELEECAE